MLISATFKNMTNMSSQYLTCDPLGSFSWLPKYYGPQRYGPPKIRAPSRLSTTFNHIKSHMLTLIISPISGMVSLLPTHMLYGLKLNGVGPVDNRPSPD